MAVLAKHTVTGLLALVNEEHLALDEHLVKATEADIRGEREAREAEAALAEEVADELPAKSWSKAKLLAYAEQHNIEVAEGATHADLVKEIVEGA